MWNWAAVEHRNQGEEGRDGKEDQADQLGRDLVFA